MGGCMVSLYGFSPDKRFRRPVALAWTKDGFLAVANRDTGSISLVDVKKRKLVGESAVGKRLSGLISIPGSSFLAAVDEEDNELILLEKVGFQIKTRARSMVAHSPVSLTASGDGRHLAVVSLWARRVSLFAMDAKGKSFQR
ncbi:MAG: hypothetical protein VB980_04325, partial [Opitutales bacterium]